MNPLSGSPWSAPETVAGFARSPPNDVLVQYASDELRRRDRGRVLDLGCGAGRNAVPIARMGWDVVGTDLSWPMLEAAALRAGQEHVAERVHLTLALMDQIPLRDATFDFVIAHGIWNLARSAAEFRNAISESARVAKDGAALFVFTFSRNTLPPHAEPVAHEPFVFTQFSGRPQCFLTEAQLHDELAAVGFTPDSSVPFREYNRRQHGTIASAAPVIYEAAYRLSRTRARLEA